MAASRRRGAALESAILDAAVAELAEVGFANLTMERVAERAGASKASIYRRWSARTELVMAAVRRGFPATQELADHGSLRADLIAVFRAVAGQLAGPAGEALRGIISETLRSPKGSLQELSTGTAFGVITAVVDRAVERGEVRPEQVRPRRLEAGFAILRYHFLVEGNLSDELIDEVVDDVVLPLLTG